VLAHVAEQRWQAEIVVVNDGSRDSTAEIVREYGRRHPIVRLVENPGNRGKGFSVRNGMLSANGDIRLFSDADLSSPIHEAGKLFAAIAAGADVAIGSRWLRAELQTERQPLVRQLFGRAYNLLLRLFFGMRFRDTQCGFKAFTRAAAEQIFPRQRIERWGFDPELLYLARQAKLRVDEVAVEWAHDERSKIHPLRDGMRMFVDLLRVRWNAWTGKYRAG
jgi:dolichyl-phosphate beta-glucosyltransferase